MQVPKDHVQVCLSCTDLPASPATHPSPPCPAPALSWTLNLEILGACPGPTPLRPTRHKHHTLLEILGACPGVDISKHSGGRYQYVPAPWLVRSMPIVWPSSTTCTPRQHGMQRQMVRIIDR